MDTEAHTTTIFDHLKVRSLILWIIFGIFIGIIFTLILTSILGKLRGGLLFTGFMNIWIILWIQHKLKTLNVSLSALIGPFPEQKNWGRWIIITIGLIAFTLGCGYLTWYQISFISPNLVERLVLSDNSFFFKKDIPNPFVIILLNFIIVVIIVPIAEEILFRGIIFQRWATKWGVRKGIVFSSILFGLLHIELLGHILFSVVVAILYIKTRTLLVPIFCHFLNNAVVFILAGIDFWITGPVKTTISDFRANIWIGIICFILSAPWIILYIVRNWPGKGCQIPYSSEIIITQNKETNS